MQTGIIQDLNPEWDYLSVEHGQHIFFYSSKSIEYLAKRYGIAATFLEGFIVFFKPVYLYHLFIANSSEISPKLGTHLRGYVPNYMEKLLTSGYNYALLDHSLIAARDL
ncbi:hypothetical protein [Polynucleobacter necessarius]|uniref:hypothetical protein n=1 Tax=Polynucleobacter necessarius TaxID=576610 RepID=UPI000E09848A|nr:hypothetical protein [Polynucleobacter necessarius]